MDYKSGFTNGVNERKQQGNADASLARTIERGKGRAVDYGSNWAEVDIDDVVKSLAPGSQPEYQDGKIIYRNAEGTLAVVADVGGGYLRIQDLTAASKSRQYLNLDGTPAHNYTDINGKQHGRSKAQYNAATHFKIKKRKPRG